MRFFEIDTKEKQRVSEQMWVAIFSVIILASLGCGFYLVTRVRKISFFKRWNEGKKALSWGIAAGAVLVLFAVLALCLNVMNALVCLLHLALFTMLSDALFFAIKKLRKKEFTRYFSGALTLVVTAVYLGVAAFMAYDVSITRYEIHTEKTASPLRIVQFADSHLGTTFHADGLCEYLDAINLESPDIVVITGDFVDDDTDRADMLAGCNALSRLSATYGVFFSYGNHDRGYYNASSRGWTAEELESAAGKTAGEINEAIAAVRGDTIKIDLKFTIAPLSENYAARIGVRYNLTEAAFGTERTYINFTNGVFQIDRLRSTLRQGCVTEAMHSWQFGEVNEFEVTVLLDRSMLEVYINGTVSATERIYPMYGDSDYIRIIDENANMKITKCVITQMKSAYSADGSITPAYFGNTGNLSDLI